MSNIAQLNTEKSIAASRRDIGDVMRKWGVKSSEWDLLTGRSLVTLTYAVNGRKNTLECSRFPSAEQNARAIYGLIDALRLADQRGMLRELVEQASALLEAPRGRDGLPWYEVLGVMPDADGDMVEAMYKHLAKKHHPDTGGSDEKMRQLNVAFDAFKAERGVA